MGIEAEARQKNEKGDPTMARLDKTMTRNRSDEIRRKEWP